MKLVFKILQQIFMFSGIMLTGFCGPLVDENYATIGTKSINGIDGFLNLLEKKGTMTRSSYLTHSSAEQADLIVHFQKNPAESEKYLTGVEDWLAGNSISSQTEENDLDDEEIEEKNDKVENPETVLRRSGPTQAALMEKNESTPDRKTPLTLLYFVRDTDTSVQFWERLSLQMEGYPDKEQFCKSQVYVRTFLREALPTEGPVLFGERRILFREGRFISDLRRDSSFFSDIPSGFPVRTVAGKLKPWSKALSESAVSYTPLLGTSMHQDLIREIKVPIGRVIIVYNAESFLNYSIVQQENRRMTSDLLTYSLNLAKNPEKKIAFIEKSLAFASEMAKEEDSMMRLLRTYPLNILIVLVFVTLLFFLISRWPHEQRPLPEISAGSREFMEHLQALGEKISRARPRLDSLEAVFTYAGKREEGARALKEILESGEKPSDTVLLAVMQNLKPGRYTASNTGRGKKK